MRQSTPKVLTGSDKKLYVIAMTTLTVAIKKFLRHLAV